MKFFRTFFFIGILIFSNSILSQTEADSTGVYSSKKPYHVVLKDGSSYTGFIVKDDGREILLRTTTIGDIYIRKTDVSRITEASDIKKINEGKYFGDEIYYTRYFLTPTAFTLNKGEANAFMPYGLYIHGQYGVSDKIDLGIGTTYWGNPLTISAKGSFEIGENLTGAIGLVGLTTTYSFGGYFGMGGVFGVVSSGTPSKNISFGAGYGIIYIDGEMAQGPYVTGGAYKRVRPQLSFMLDAMYFPNIESYMAIPGIRYFRKRRDGEMFDFGVMLFGTNYAGNYRPLTGFPLISYIITL